MESVESGAVVVAHLANPREKLWGLLLRIDSVGVVVRGLDLDSVEDWLRQERSGGGGLVCPSTVFVPLHRVQRIYLDERGAAESIAERYAVACGGDVRAALGGDGWAEACAARRSSKG